MLPSLPKSAVSFDEITSETDGVKKELDGSICENSVSVSLVFFLFLYFILFFTFSLSLFFLIAIAVLIKYLLYTLNKYIQIYFIFIFSLLVFFFNLQKFHSREKIYEEFWSRVDNENKGYVDFGEFESFLRENAKTDISERKRLGMAFISVNSSNLSVPTSACHERTGCPWMKHLCLLLSYSSSLIQQIENYRTRATNVLFWEGSFYCLFIILFIIYF